MTLYKLKTFFQVKLTIFFFSFCSETVSQLLDENWHYLSKLTSLLQDVSHEREQSITVCDTVFFFSSGDYCWKHPNTRSTPDQLHALQVLPRDTTQSVKLFILSSVTNWASVCLNLFLFFYCNILCLVILAVYVSSFWLRTRRTKEEHFFGTMRFTLLYIVI